RSGGTQGRAKRRSFGSEAALLMRDRAGPLWAACGESGRGESLADRLGQAWVGGSRNRSGEGFGVGRGELRFLGPARGYFGLRRLRFGLFGLRRFRGLRSLLGQ